MIMCRILLTVIAGFIALTTFGQTISLQEAASRAKDFMENQNKHIVSRSNRSAVYSDVDVSPYLYVFNISTGGYVIVSSENNTESILGYSTTGHIDDKESIPDNMKQMLKNYETQIEYAKNNPNKVSPKSRANTSPVIRKEIKPLVSIHWDQGNPYNKYCPEIDGKKAWVGCVPTAMAQIIGHYKWPDKGHGEYWFTLNDKKYSIDLDTITFNWKNMDMDNIAKLMMACGYSCGVNYGLKGSGGGMNNAYKALINSFYYKGECIHISGSGKEPMDHFDYFYNALAENKPLLCSVVGIDNDGHAVVCDGFDGKGFFHINFGWGGSKDGYFRLYDIKEVDWYTFGAFNYAIVVEPDYEMKGNETNNHNTSMYYMPFISISSKANEIGSSWEYNYGDKNEPDDIYNNMIDREPSGDLSNVEVGIRIVGSDGKEAYFSIYRYDEEGEPICGESFDGYSTRVDYLVKLVSGYGFKEGRYKVYPVYRKLNDSDWHDVIVDIQFSVNYVLMIVRGDDIVFSTPEIKNVSVSVDDNRTIHVYDNATSQKVRIFNMYGLQVYSGNDDEITLDCPGIYTVKIGSFPAFYKSVVVK